MKGSSLILYHHLGLGDHIMCFGIVQYYCTLYDKVITFSKGHNYESVCFMYKDLLNLEVVKADDRGATEYINENPQHLVKYIGFGGLDYSSPLSLDAQFYKMANLSLEYKYFPFNSMRRDKEKEDKLFSKLVPENTDYIFLHDDADRGMKIDLPKGKYVVQAKKEHTSCIFDYCKIIEKASEVHVIESSFFFLVDCVPYENLEQSLYCHRYVRVGSFKSPIEIPHHQKKWSILHEKL